MAWRSRGRRGGARLPSVRNRAAGRRRSLPLFDRIAAGCDDRSTDLFPSRGARQSDCLRNLVVLLSQRVDPGRRDKGGDRCARPAEKLPFILVPGSSGRRFDTTIRINNLGFRGPDLPRDKGDAFRIVALGESQPPGRRCATARSRGRSSCRTCSTDTPRAAANRGHQRRNRGLYTRKQAPAHAPRYPAAQA